MTTPNDGITINTIGSTVTCQSLQISWTFSNPNTNQTYGFAIVNDAELDGPSELASPIYQVLASGVTNSTTAFTWSQVDVPPGSYQINAYDTSSDIYVSNSFQVELGADLSCLNGIYTEGAAPSSTPVPATPENAITSSSNGLSHGAIAGIVIGICAGILAFFLLFFFARRRRINRLSAIRRSRFAPYAFGAAGANGSNTRPPSDSIVKAPLQDQSPFNAATAGPNEYPPDKKSVPTAEVPPYEKAIIHTRVASTSRVPPPSYDAGEGNAWA